MSSRWRRRQQEQELLRIIPLEQEGEEGEGARGSLLISLPLLIISPGRPTSPLWTR
jgi:hypothetical protein